MKTFRPFYIFLHYIWTFLAACYYRFPSRKIAVVMVTGTKGKSSVVEILSHILSCSGFKVAKSNTIGFKIGDKEWANTYKMSVPGKGFLQKFLRQAVNAGCDYAIVEMTSQGIQYFRHSFIDLDALIFTNLTPEHIEAHGSFDNYKKEKLKLVKSLEESPKPRKIILANRDDKHYEDFLDCNIKEKYTFGTDDTEHPESYPNISFYWQKTRIQSDLAGEFNTQNILAAITTAYSLGISEGHIAKALSTLHEIKGRMEFIKNDRGIEVIVDYAHTPESFKFIFETFKNKKIIAVFGGTGGGRDTWKRKVLGEIANRYAQTIILTTDDPYEEDVYKICEDIREGIEHDDKVEIIVDRKEAIQKALSIASSGNVVLILGKGSESFIASKSGSKIPHSDKETVEEILNKN